MYYGNVAGVLRDARTNQPLANVAISTTPATSAVVTDAQGNFLLERVPTGRVAITASKTEYQQATTTITVEENQTAQVAIILTKSQAAAAPAAPTRPAPADQATVPGPDVTLEWHPVRPAPLSDSLRYDVLLYESNSAVRRQLLTNSRDTTVRATGLRYNTTYFWQVTVRNANGAATRSNLWSFTTEALPDNRYLYARQVNGNTDIYSSNATGSTLLRLTTSAFVETAPRLSPNRDRIAYASNATGQYQLYTMNRDGSEPRQVTQLPIEGYFNFGTGYCWSPDGSQLLYSSYNKLYRINRDGTGLVLVATAPPDRHFRECDWTSQGNRIVVQTVGVSIYDAELYYLQPDGTGLTLAVGNLPGRLDSPSFSIDGRRLLYTRDVDGFDDVTGRQLNAHIFSQRLDGSDVVDISAGTNASNGTNNSKPIGFNDILPQYAPDGSKIIFVQVNNVARSVPEVWTVELNGSNRVRLFENATYPDWK
ncbi:carboxypeptidase-like regulatory domain-containing protein [Hymenobacter aerilatus]|uniref:Carboxypeptidase-like regulatory domain-containing protein n=1 Tax=Hymenobacter aerilatus TaxID=2932251 RepID=A0A8T9SV07_9BACT|nr:carboxypeptidase-like regulatory domain-containing protein [Hymenobacter aerilatus]UOR03599.1 carboxypeptidase-like regulatory domain-containing protein [Hymenobacter aerilatus]